MTDITFEQRMLEAVEQTVIKQILAGTWMSTPSYDDRVKLAPSHLRDLYAQIDMDRVKALVKERVERQLADKFFDALATEFANDVKQILQNRELREDVRAMLRAKIRESITPISEEK